MSSMHVTLSSFQSFTVHCCEPNLYRKNKGKIGFKDHGFSVSPSFLYFCAQIGFRALRFDFVKGYSPRFQAVLNWDRAAMSAMSLCLANMPCTSTYNIYTCLSIMNVGSAFKIKKTICPTWHGPFSSETQDVFLQDVVSVGATAMRNMFELLVLLMQLRRTGMEILMGNLGSKGLLVETCGIREGIIETYWNWKPRKPRKPIPKIIAGWKYGAAKWPRWPSQFTPIPYFSITSHTSHTSSMCQPECHNVFNLARSGAHTCESFQNSGFTTMFVNVRASWPSMTFRFS